MAVFSLFRRVMRAYGLVLPAMALTGLVAYLIWTNHQAAQKQRDALDEQVHREAGQLARSLHAFIAIQLETVLDCAGSSYVQAFYENRALGMSPEYGLRLSLSTITERFHQVRRLKRSGDVPIFRRLRLVEETGITLVDSSDADNASSPPVRSLSAHPQINLSDDAHWVEITAPVMFQGAVAGHVVAGIDVGLLEHLAGTGKRDHLFVFLATHDAPTHPLGHETDHEAIGTSAFTVTNGNEQEWCDADHRYLLVNAAIEGTPLTVGIFRASDRYFGSEPWQSLLILSVLFVAVLGGSVVLMWHMGRTRTLGALVSELQVREQIESERSRMTLNREVAARRQVEAERTQLGNAIEQAAEAVIITDTEGIVLYVNPAFTTISGWAREDVLGKMSHLLSRSTHDDQAHRMLWDELRAGRSWSGRIVNRHRNGALIYEHATISPVRDADGVIQRFIEVKQDITRQVQLEEQLMQAQKLEAIGQLASGIAHEINTPLQFVSDNLRFLTTGFADIEGVLAEIERRASQDLALNSPIAQVRRNMEAADVPYLRGEIPRALEQSREGIERVGLIVKAMKDFSTSGSHIITPTDVNAAIDSTVIVSRNEWCYVAELEQKFDLQLPLVPLLPGDFKQVMLHLIVNAAQAITDRRTKDPSSAIGHITITTCHDQDQVVIEIADDGCGIPDSAKPHIFEPFFTTREVGRGTGQGLTFVHTVIAKKLKGAITFTSTVGVGTVFTIRLPVTV